VSIDVLLGPDGVERCAWVGGDPEYRRYHDEEWGVPLHRNRALFEKLSDKGSPHALSAGRRPGQPNALTFPPGPPQKK
jgi:DNA-3-methyladenine glycosylase I